MFVASRFDCDTNDTLHWIQHDTYFDGQASVLFRACRKRYCDAARLLAVTTPLVGLIENRDKYDHRVLQSAYQIIAAHHRFSVGSRADQTLFENGDQWICRLTEEWLRAFSVEVEHLTQKDAICIAVLTAVAYQNEPEGRAAEQHLDTLLQWQFGELSIDRWCKLHSSNTTNAA